MDYYGNLIENNYYHIVSRAVGNEKLFKEPENYRYFLQRYADYIQPVAETYAYCLLPNHFHFLVRIRPHDTIASHAKMLKPGFTETDGWQPVFVMKQFSNFLNSYTKSFNKMYQRKGSLFIDYLRRVEITDEHQYSATLFYVHRNAVHHGIVKSIEAWPHSSYHAHLSNGKTMLARAEVLDWFGGREKFIEFHQQPIHLKNAVVVE